MMDGRLGVVKRQEDSHRKLMFVLNDVAKYRRDELKHCLEKERKEEIQKKDRSAGRVRKKAVERHVLGRCLELKREDTQDSPNGNLFGHYNGRSIDSFSSDVEEYMAKKDPKVKKKKEKEILIKKYKDTGKILEENQIKDKVRDYLENRWGVQYKTTEKGKKETETEMHEPQIRVLDDKLPDIFSFYKQTNIQSKLHSGASERRLSRIEIRDESGQFVPLNSVNALRGPRRSIFPSIDNKQRRASTFRRPSELNQMPKRSDLRRSSEVKQFQSISLKRQSESKQFPSQTMRKKSMLPPLI